MARSRQRGPIAQHARQGRPHAARRIVAWVSAAVVSVLVAGIGVAAYAYYDFTHTIQQNAVDIGATGQPAPGLGAYPGAFNLLVVGTDECDPSLKHAIGEDRCSESEAGHHLNDVTILVHVSHQPRRVTVVSFPRDLRVDRPECTDTNGNVTAGTAKLNTAYDAGGLKCVADTINGLTGQKIDFAAKVSFMDVIKITDAVGGVEVCIGADGLQDENTMLDWPAGLRTVKGLEALQFLRTRYGLRGESDLARISNQQQYMSRLVNKLRSAETLSDAGKLLNLAGIVSKNITTDKQLADPIRMAQLGLTLKDVAPKDIAFVSYPVVDGPQGYVITSEADAATLFDAIAKNEELRPTRVGGGVTEQDPKPTLSAPGTQAPTATQAPTGGATPAPSSTGGPVELGWATPGQTAAQSTCSAR